MEIERKFLVRGEFRSQVKKKYRITQGYLSSVPERSVRVRIKGKKAWITVKGPGNETGTTRFEWEKQISVSDAVQLLNICEPGVIDKTRHIVEYEGHVFEVDEFHGDNDGLIVAEIELKTEYEPFEKPNWLGNEITGDIRYYNAMLSGNPYKYWK